jgi:SAM-dependent methyltransferase
VASVYDEIPEPMVDGTPVDDAVKVLADLAGTGRVLELAIGTGRVGLPLASLGTEVAGIELSRAMLRRLRAKPGGESIPVEIGDMTATRAPGPPFSLVYLAFNTIQNVTTQAGQVAVFRNAAAHLVPGGRFLVESSIPELRKLPIGDSTVVFEMTDTHIGIDEYDVANQGLVSHHFSKIDGRFAYSSGPFRYVWPAELDLMAQLAGLQLWERWGGWDRRPFESESRMHVSIWEKP